MTRESGLQAIRLIREKNLPILNIVRVTSREKRDVIQFFIRNNMEDVAEYIQELDLEDFADWIVNSCGDDEELQYD